MMPSMNANHPGLVSEATEKLVLHRLAAYLYRLHARGDKPGKPSSPYYALLMPAGKQFWQSSAAGGCPMAPRSA